MIVFNPPDDAIHDSSSAVNASASCITPGTSRIPIKQIPRINAALGTIDKRIYLEQRNC